MEFKIDIHGKVQDFDYWHKRFYEEVGTPDEVLPSNEEVINAYRGLLPNELLNYWEEFGFCSFLEGGFYLTNPDDYKELLEQYLVNTPLANREGLYVICKTSFGKLYLWERGKGNVADINLLTNLISFYADVDRKKLLKKEEELEITSFLALKNKELIDIKDKNNKALFDRLLEKFKKVEYTEMYGYKLLSPLGGEKVIENFDKVNLFIYAEIQYSMELPYFTIIDLENSFYGF